MHTTAQLLRETRLIDWLVAFLLVFVLFSLAVLPDLLAGWTQDNIETNRLVLRNKLPVSELEIFNQ